MKWKKIILYSASGVTVLLIMVLAICLTRNSEYKRLVPPPPELSSLSKPLREQIQDAMRKTQRWPSADRIGYLGMVYHSSSFYEKASQCYALAAKRNGSEWTWDYYLGYLNREMGETKASIKNFTQVTDKDPGNFMAWYYTGEGYQDMGADEMAKSIYIKIINPEKEITLPEKAFRKDYYSLQTYARFQLARIYQHEQRNDLAEKTLQEIIRNQLSFGPAYRALGNICNLKGDTALGNKYITRAGDLKIYTPPVDEMADRLALVSRSELYLMKQIDDAEKGAYPGWAVTLIKHALTYYSENKYLISKAIRIFLLMGMPDRAMPYISDHLRLFHGDLNELKIIADLCLKKGLYPQSRQYYAHAAALMPDDLDIQLSTILCLGYEGRKQEAIDSINTLNKKYKGNLKILTDCAYIMLMVGEPEKARVYVNEVIRTFPDDPKAQQLAGILMEREGRFQNALNLYESSFASKPGDLPTVRYLGDLLMRMNLWERSVKLYRKALLYNPNEPYLLETLGTLLVLCPDTTLRNVKEGMEFAERAFYNKLSTTATKISAGRCLSEAFAATGDQDRAYQYASACLDMAQKEKAPQEFIQELARRVEQFRK